MKGAYPKLIKISLKIFLLIPCLILSGCWDRKEVERNGYVIGLGLDKAENSKKIEVTYLIANPEVGSLQGGGGSNEPPEEIITLTASDFITVRNSANAIIARQITYDLLKVIVVSEELAKDKEFIRKIYDVTKDREIRRDAKLIVTKEKASTFFKNNDPKLETRPHKYFDLMITRGMETGITPNGELHRFFKITEGDADLFLAIYATTKKEKSKENANEDEFLPGQIDVKGKTNSTQVIGSAIFKEGKMIGTLTGEETRIAMLLDETSDISDLLSTYPDPFDDQYRMAIRIIKKQANEVNFNLKGQKPKINITLPLTVEVLSDPSMVNYATNGKRREQLKRHLEKSLEKKMEEFVKKTQKKFKGNPFNWSLDARREFSTIPEYQNYNWMKKYPLADVNVEVKIKFGEFGKQTKVPNLKLMRD